MSNAGAPRTVKQPKTFRRERAIKTVKRLQDMRAVYMKADEREAAKGIDMAIHIMTMEFDIFPHEVGGL